MFQNGTDPMTIDVEAADEKQTVDDVTIIDPDVELTEETVEKQRADDCMLNSRSLRTQPQRSGEICLRAAKWKLIASLCR